MHRQLSLLICSLLIASLCLPVLGTIQPAKAQSQASSPRYGVDINYGSDEDMFVDLAMNMAGWSPLYNAAPGYVVPLSANGYPTSGSATSYCISPINGYPDGIYNFYGENIPVTYQYIQGVNTPIPQIVFNGTATDYRSYPNSGWVPNSQTITLTNGGATCTFTCQISLDIGSGRSTEIGYPMPAGNADFQIILQNCNASYPPTNFHMIQPGYAPWQPGDTYDEYGGTHPIYTQKFLQALAPFCCLRYIAWMFNLGNSLTSVQVSAFNVTSWASRPQPLYYGAGTCYENMIALCNATGCDMWINIPLCATDDWATGFATLLTNPAAVGEPNVVPLNPNLHCYYELSDELWNSGYYPDWLYVQTLSSTDPDLNFIGPPSGSLPRHGGEMAKLFMRYVMDMAPILNSPNGMGRPVFCGQFDYTPPVYTIWGLNYIQQVYGPPVNFIYAIGGAGYFSLSSADTSQYGLPSGLYGPGGVFQSITDDIGTYTNVSHFTGAMGKSWLIIYNCASNTALNSAAMNADKACPHMVKPKVRGIYTYRRKQIRAWLPLTSS